MSEDNYNSWVEVGPRDEDGRARAKCRCGKVKMIRVNRQGKPNSCARSCGCLRRENFKKAVVTHNASRTKAFTAWKGMKRRVRPDADQSYDYHGRGISVCSRWLRSFEAFLSDMGQPPKGLTLDRKDNDKGYHCGSSECEECSANGWEPNCRWATRAAQVRNRRNSRNFTWKGKTQCLKDWASELGVSYAVLRYRTDIGYTFEQAIAIKKYSKSDKSLLHATNHC